MRQVNCREEFPGRLFATVWAVLPAEMSQAPSPLRRFPMPLMTVTGAE